LDIKQIKSNQFIFISSVVNCVVKFSITR